MYMANYFVKLHESTVHRTTWKKTEYKGNLPATATKYKTNYKTKARLNIWQSKNALTTALTTEQNILYKHPNQHFSMDSTIAL